jgi:hypothetical protein
MTARYRRSSHDQLFHAAPAGNVRSDLKLQHSGLDSLTFECPDQEVLLRLPDSLFQYPQPGEFLLGDRTTPNFLQSEHMGPLRSMD